MINNGLVYGSIENAKPIIIGKDTVYIHTDIQEHKITNDDGTEYIEYSYQEVQYDKGEFIKKLFGEDIEVMLGEATPP